MTHLLIIKGIATEAHAAAARHKIELTNASCYSTEVGALWETIAYTNAPQAHVIEWFLDQDDTGPYPIGTLLYYAKV